MVTEIDLRDRPEASHREALFEAFDGAAAGDEFEVVADGDVDPHLVRYQIERNRRLHWAYASADAEPREARVAVGEPLDDALGSIDVRDLTPQRRHAVLLDTFDELNGDEGFVLVNDHDPRPLYHELRSTHGDVVDWEYASRDGGEWRVELRKTADSEADDGDLVTRYDVREIPAADRHETIHHRYGMIPEGGTVELIAPHEPRPLQREFQQRYGDAYTWEVVESEPGRCRVQVTKEAAVDEEEATEKSGDGPSHSNDATGSTPADGGAIEVTDELDVRDRPPAERHELIFEGYDDLDGGEGFVLVNDHDPKPLYHQFEAEAGPEFHWEYRKEAPGEFRVLIGKAEQTGTEDG